MPSKPKFERGDVVYLAPRNELLIVTDVEEWYEETYTVTTRSQMPTKRDDVLFRYLESDLILISKHDFA